MRAELRSRGIVPIPAHSHATNGAVEIQVKALKAQLAVRLRFSERWDDDLSDMQLVHNSTAKFLILGTIMDFKPYDLPCLLYITMSAYNVPL